MQKILIAFGVFIFLVVIIYLDWFFIYNKINQENDIQIQPPAVCTLDARICPDGSAVGRSGPQCDFTACPKVVINDLSTSTPSSATNTKPNNNPVINATSSHTTGTLSGVMTIGPICPVQNVDKPCLPTEAMFASNKLLVFKEQQKVLTAVATLTPDRLGNFSTDLLVGNYYIRLDQPQNGSLGSVTGLPLTVNIEGGSTTSITVNIDTGIR